MFDFLKRNLFAQNIVSILDIKLNYYRIVTPSNRLYLELVVIIVGRRKEIFTI